MYVSFHKAGIPVKTSFDKCVQTVWGVSNNFVAFYYAYVSSIQQYIFRV